MSDRGEDAAHRALDVDAAMSVEPRVLARDRRIFRRDRDLVERHRQSVLRVEGGKGDIRVAVLCIDGGGLGELVDREVLGEALEDADRATGGRSDSADRRGHADRDQNSRHGAHPDERGERA